MSAKNKILKLTASKDMPFSLFFLFWKIEIHEVRTEQGGIRS